MLPGPPCQAMTAVETINQIVPNRKSRGSCPRQTGVFCTAAEPWRNVLASCPSPIPYQSPNSDLFRNVKRQGNGTSSGNEGGTIYSNFLGSCRSTIELHPQSRAFYVMVRRNVERLVSNGGDVSSFIDITVSRL